MLINYLNGDDRLSREIEMVVASLGLDIWLEPCDSVEDVKHENGVMWVWRVSELELAHFFHLNNLCSHQKVIVLLDRDDPMLMKLIHQVGVIACIPLTDIKEQLPTALSEMVTHHSSVKVHEERGKYQFWNEGLREKTPVENIGSMVSQVAWETPDFFVLIGLDKHVIYMNKTARLMMGISLDAKIEELSFDQFHNGEIGLFVDEVVVPTIVQNGSWVGEQVLKLFGRIDIPALFVVNLNRDSKGNPAFISVIAHDIRKVKSAEKNVRESRAVVDRFLDVSPMVVRSVELLPPHKQINVTPNISRILGYGPVAFIEKHSDWMTLIHPDDVLGVSEAFKSLPSKKKAEIAYRIQHADGKYRWLQEQLILNIDSSGRSQDIFGYFWDITEKQEAIDALSFSEARFRTLAEVSKDFIFSVDMFGRFLYVNPAICELFGLPPEAINGKPYNDFFEGAEKSFPGLALPGGMNRKWPDYTESAIRVNGSAIWVGTWISLVVSPTGEPHIQGIARDITEKIEKERELSEAYYQAQRTSLVRSRMVAVVTKQFQKPLSEIITSSEGLITHGSIQDDHVQRLVRIQQNAERMLAMLESVTAFDVIEPDKATIGHNGVELLGFIEKISEKVKKELGVKRTILIKSQSPDALVILDPIKLRQIIEPIIRNALMYSDQTKKVEIDISDGQDFTITVRDYGLGIAPDDLPLIYEPFFRGANVLEFPGIGLDLPLAKNAADILGADIHVESMQGLGTTVTICVPKQ